MCQGLGSEGMEEVRGKPVGVIVGSNRVVGVVEEAVPQCRGFRRK